MNSRKLFKKVTALVLAFSLLFVAAPVAYAADDNGGTCPLPGPDDTIVTEWNVSDLHLSDAQFEQAKSELQATFPQADVDIKNVFASQIKKGDECFYMLRYEVSGSNIESHSGLGFLYDENKSFIESQALIGTKQNDDSVLATYFKGGKKAMEVNIDTKNLLIKSVSKFDENGAATRVLQAKSGVISCLKKCFNDMGVPSWILGTIGAICGVACIGTFGTGCAVCFSGVLAGYGTGAINCGVKCF